MVLRVFYISTTGRRDIRKRQIHVLAVLSSWKLEHEAIDVAAPENETDRDFVIENGKKTEDDKILLPQIFKEEECCGDYLDFLQAIEHEKLLLFLKQITQEEFDALERSKNGETKETKVEDEEKAEGEEDAEKKEGEEEEEDTEKKEGEDEETEKKEGENEETEDGEKAEKTTDEDENKEEGDETTKEEAEGEESEKVKDENEEETG
ncbi:unnamed protein product [Rotaria magnacalcarata]|uniref:Uncharacterized protein n=1 Tax=Rotaria magnacalcarata TaxID=392030 RepID=A0A8S3IA97_9BILA|nr:unnamed protein product [Rotaria magnacalcarata]